MIDELPIEEPEHETVGWLAEHTGLAPEEIEKGLEEGRLRRNAIVFELVDAGLTGRELVEMVVALTGLPAQEACELIAAEAPQVEIGTGRPPVSSSSEAGALDHRG